MCTGLVPALRQFQRKLTATWSSLKADRKSTRLNSSHLGISYAVFCLKRKMVNITSSVNSRERSGINNILHALNPLFTINVTMRDSTSKNVYSKVNRKEKKKWSKKASD